MANIKAFIIAALATMLMQHVAAQACGSVTVCIPRTNLPRRLTTNTFYSAMGELPAVQHRADKTTVQGLYAKMLRIRFDTIYVYCNLLFSYD